MEIRSNVNRISKHFRLPSLGLTEQDARLAKEDKLFSPKIKVAQDNYIFGIEVEVEKVPDPVINSTYYPYWTVTTDNSLRNHGLEFVSLPLRMTQIECALIQLMERSLPKDADFSHRTSIHVHMNVRDLTIYQIANLVLLYTVVENVLFNWVGHEREKNIFCVKLTDTTYVGIYHQINHNIQHTVDSWNKYTALNLVPIHDKGTVEFRHMHGTNDIPRIMNWVNMLACLKNASKTKSTQEIFNSIAELNSTSKYELFLKEIFGEWAEELIKCTPNLKDTMEETVSYIKLMSVYHQENAQILNTDEIIDREIEAIEWEATAPLRAPQPELRLRPLEPVNREREAATTQAIRRTATQVQIDAETQAHMARIAEQLRTAELARANRIAAQGLTAPINTGN